MAQKCVHRGCEKTFTDENEVCRYHPGPPVFHEGQKGWKCCKPRVLTFDEFLEIEPCTEGKHSTTDLPPAVEKKEVPAESAAQRTQSVSDNSQSQGPAMPRAPINPASASSTPPPPPPPESDDDDDTLEIPDGRICRRRACGASYTKGAAGGRSDQENCVHHPGVPIFHEGSKGYTCCKRRVLDFDDFMKIGGCKTKPRHMFVGSGKKEKASASGAEELLEAVRTDFYQTPTSVIASFFLKKINKETAKVIFTESSIQLDLPTTDSPPKRYRAEVPLFGKIDTAKTTHKILGTKLEVTLVKNEVSSWPVLRADDQLTGEILQVGRAGRAVQ
ncbi:HSP20-like chaperone [Coniella lustricola]|uniref:HSP20-like chaperone n=1 Tax=Coniella lustricola TaxID=2025994 RepID=A0A2T3ADM8_9PEZI|nr:HSP20-like chaperone [Coniella lustricola]